MVSSPREALDVLGLAPDADADAIRRAFRRRARELHPDAGGDVDAFQQLQAAVAVLLDGRSTRPAGAASPSTGDRFRPSTSTTFAGTDTGEASSPRWHDGGVDTTTVDWDRTLPSPSHRWSRELVALAAARPLEATVVHPITGRSRRPGSLLNRFVGAISPDLLTTFRVAPAVGRGIVGHDIELVVTAPPGAGRRLLDDATLPAGWTKERRPDSTVATLLVHPSRDRRSTAVRVADHLHNATEQLGWPLDQWRRTS